MKHRRFGREFKLEAVKLVRERGVTAAKAVRDIDLRENLLRKWVGRSLAEIRGEMLPVCELPMGDFRHQRRHTTFAHAA